MNTLTEDIIFLLVSVLGIALTVYQIYLHGWDLDETFFEEVDDE